MGRGARGRSVVTAKSSEISRSDGAGEGAESRLATLYVEYREAIHARCRRILGDGDAAEDATHEVFVRALRSRGALPPRGHEYPWLLRIALNHCLNARRGQRRLERALAQLSREEPAVELEATVVLRDLWGRAVATAEEALLRPVLLRHVEGLGQEQIAALLGICRRTLNHRFARFSEALDQLLAA